MLEKIILMNKQVSAHLQLSGTNSCVIGSLTLHLSNIYSTEIGIWAFWSLLDLPLQQACFHDCKLLLNFALCFSGLAESCWKIL